MSDEKQNEERLTSALNVMRRMPPTTIENSLAGLLELTPQLTDDLLNHVDQPLKVSMDTKKGLKFVLCDFNRDGDSYRSPWSNEYFPELEDGIMPTPRLRQMEIEANTIFDSYRKLYFDTGLSSVYFFTTDENDAKGFGACFLVHKDVDAQKGLNAAVWDSIHVFDVKEVKAGTFEYKLTTTVMVSLRFQTDKVGAVDLSGSMTQQTSMSHPVNKDRPHVSNMGRMLEEMELKIRNSIEAIYIQKTREVVSGIRTASASNQRMFDNLAQSLKDRVVDHGKTRKTDSQ